MKPQLRFPCDCISSTPACEEPWARVAKEGMFKDGTKESILNRLHEEPRTIAQLARNLRLAQPTVFRHLSELEECGLVKEFDPDEKDYTVERYYKPDFPVVSRKDQKEIKESLQQLSDEIASIVRKRLPSLEKQLQSTDTMKQGWRFEELAQYLFHTASRDARQKLEKEGLLSGRLSSSGLDFVFWAQE